MINISFNKTINRTKEFMSIINRHNIFSFSASLAYYSTLALAPFLLILLKVGSLIGQDTQDELIFQAEFILGEDVGKIMQIIFSNINQGVNLASISGIIGLFLLLFTASVVFLQLRISLDTILGNYNPDQEKTFYEFIGERIFSMVIVIATAILFFLSIFISNIIKYFAGDGLDKSTLGNILLIGMNYLINMGLFTAIYYFVPTKKTTLNHSCKMAMFTAVFYLIGKLVIALYLEKVAGNSVYGAAGSLLVFLVWAYYSAFTLFLSMELFLFFESKKEV